ncbi:hypothetical protein L345_15687, partial [Ophiophagus hannah]
GFATLIKEWPGNLYNNPVIVHAVLDHLKKDPQNRTLLKTLAELYTYDQRYRKALEIYLTLRHKDVFQLIHKHNLFSSIRDKIVLLMEFDSEKAVDMFLDNEDKISIDKVVEELKDRPELQHVALEICQQRVFVEETVYLLSRMGNSRSALKMIMEDLNDVDKAIEFAKEQDDAELWEDLILYSIDKPPTLRSVDFNGNTELT